MRPTHCNHTLLTKALKHKQRKNKTINLNNNYKTTIENTINAQLNVLKAPRPKYIQSRPRILA